MPIQYSFISYNEMSSRMMNQTTRYQSWKLPKCQERTVIISFTEGKYNILKLTSFVKQYYYSYGTTKTCYNTFLLYFKNSFNKWLNECSLVQWRSKMNIWHKIQGVFWFMAAWVVFFCCCFFILSVLICQFTNRSDT